MLIVGAEATHEARCQVSEPLPSSLSPDLPLSEPAATNEANENNNVQLDTKADELTYPRLGSSSSSSSSSKRTIPEDQQQSTEHDGTVASASANTTIEATEADNPFEIGTRFKDYDVFYKLFIKWYKNLYPRSAIAMSLQKSTATNKTRYYPRCADLSTCEFRLTLHTIVGESSVIIKRVGADHPILELSTNSGNLALESRAVVS